MTILCDVKVLEDWLKVDTLVLDCSSVLFQEILNSLHLLWICGKIFSPCKESVILSDSSDSSIWIFVDSSSCESFVDACDKCSVLEETFWVISLVLICQELILIICQIEFHARHNCLELSTGNSAFSQFIEIMEELLNSDSLHQNSCSNSIFYIFWVIGDIYALLLESIVDYINFICWLLEVSANLRWCNAKADCLLLLSLLCHVSREHVLWTVNILDKFEVIHLIVVPAVTVLPDNQIEDLRIRWHQV